MTDMHKEDQVTQKSGAATRRAMLRLGAVALPAALTVKPALAQTLTSTINCTIPIPDRITDDGDFDLERGESIYYAPPSGDGYTGQQIKDYNPDLGTPVPLNADSPAQFKAHYNYVTTNLNNRDGMTCFVSILNSRS